MADDSDDRTTHPKPEVREFPTQLYAHRIKVIAPSAAMNSKSAKVMFDILAKKKIPIAAATEAVRKSLNVAANAVYAVPQLKNSQQFREQGANLIDELILKLSAFAEAISKLPPSSKSILNRRIAEITTGNAVFDTEVFIEVVDCVAACLPNLSPKKLADDALLLLLAGASPEVQSPIVGLWESIPSVTRSCVERQLTTRPPKSGVGLLNVIPKLLSSRRQPVPLGAPPSPNFKFVRELNRIWRSLGLRSGRSYDAAEGTGHKSSFFQQFGDAALAAVGNSSRISGRQVDNLKKKQNVKPHKPDLSP